MTIKHHLTPLLGQASSTSRVPSLTLHCSKTIKRAHFTDAVWGGWITGIKASIDQQRSPKPCPIQRT